MPVQDSTVAKRHSVGTVDGPLVLVVGSHEPRKNHLTVLAAAERLWRQGLSFRLTFIGGSGWLNEEFHEDVVRLRDLGRPVQVLFRADEELLWASYREARLSVFVSLVEGYGLPITESLSCGTPVITSNWGSMREVAAAGGVLTVDPRSVDELAAAMSILLSDDVAWDELHAQALARTDATWDEYADEVWSSFVEEQRRGPRS